MLEYEKKIMLTAEEYLTIVKLMRQCVLTQTQINYYFDTDDFAMNKNGITCRIRAKDGKYSTTIKYHDTDHPDCSVEEDLFEKTEYNPNIFNALGLRYQGELVTERIVLHRDSDCEMVIDRNTYFDYTDFEIEVEYCKDSEHRAQLLLEGIAEALVAEKVLTDMNVFLARTRQGKSKSQRFFQRKKQRGG